RGCNPTSSKFIHTWLRFGEIMRGSLRAQRFKLLFSPKSLSINIEFPKSLVLSPTLFLLVLNYATLVT
ncbi:hypothetical protein ACK4QY_14660, partial [Proteus mirabilis]